MSWDVYTVYSVAWAIIGLSIFWWLHHRLKLKQKALVQHIEDRKRFDAINTESPIDNATGEARERGLESVATRFSVMRRLLIPLLALLVVVALVVPLLGRVSATFLSLLVAAGAVLIGIAAKPLLENLFAGIVMSFSQPIRIGDTVRVDDHFGTIEDISITHTTIKIWDWRRYMVPNRCMMEKEFINYSINDKYQWAHVEFWIAPDTDLDQVRDIAVAAPSTSKHFADYEEPTFWIMEMAKEGVRCWIAAWADTPSAAWQLTHDIRAEISRRFQAAGIKTHSYRHEVDSPFALIARGQEERR